MKKFIAFVLIATMLLGLAACGAINETEVSILWSDLSYNEDGSIAMVPNSLINAIERAMYIENINYTHYDGNNDQPTQYKQATDALNAGCAALVVELVDPACAGLIMEAAKEKGVPVIFINANISATVPTYDKAFSILADEDSIGKVQGEQIAASLIQAKKDTYVLNPDLDRNRDGIISCLTIGDVSTVVESINIALQKVMLPDLVIAAEAEDASVVEGLTEGIYKYTEKKLFGEKETEISLLDATNGTAAELIITADDATAQNVLVALQAKGFNKDRLTTHFINLYTVGNTADYKALVLKGRPAGEHKDDNVQEYFKSMQYIVDLRNVEEDDLDAMIYTTTDIIGNGRISGTTVKDYDSIAIAVSTVLRNLLKGNEAFEGINLNYIDGIVVEIPYTTN